MSYNIRIIQIIIGLLAFSLGHSAFAETATTYELKKAHRGYPCLMNVTTKEGPKITVSLSDYRDIWWLDFDVSNRPTQYRKFFDKDDLVDIGALENAFQNIKVGGRSFRINKTMFLHVEKKEIDVDAYASFSIKERHNVAAALGAMQNDGFAIRDLISVDNIVDAYSSFRVCAYDAMGLREGEHVKTDNRAEYRMIYESSLEDWVEYMATADGCNAKQYDDQVVEEVIAQAADAFYPGILNILKRREYRKDMTTRISHPKFMGSIKAMNGNCILAGRLADASRAPVDRSIEAANDID